MKSSVFALLFSVLIPAPLFAGEGFDHATLDSLLKGFVDEKGMVDYEGLKKDRKDLDRYLDATGGVKKAVFDKWSEAEQLAFLINVYNAETLQLIIDHYPVKSIKKIGPVIGTPWDVKCVRLFGDTTTLNFVEHRIMRKDYDEPRIHFAIVCAAMGCPPLRAEAFTADRLEEQLDDQAAIFLGETGKNRVEGDTLYLSSIFKWFGGDFKTGGKSVQEYVNPWFDEDVSRLRIRYTDYDWSLNQQ